MRAALTLSLLLLSNGVCVHADDAKGIELFESRIRPALIKYCYECHSDNKKEVKGELFLDTAAGWRKGGESGPAIVPGMPEKSLLLEALRYEGLEMPPAGRLPKQVVKDFERWIQLGAVDPRNKKSPSIVPRVIDIEKGRTFWSFQPLKTEVPNISVSDDKSSLTQIDRFVLNKLKKVKLKPAAEADRRTLIRRLYFDLIGLPPQPSDVDLFVNDTSQDAYSKLVDTLLKSPQFGVHWGRHWLDVARYADSNGGDFNATFHNGWRYRDYVVNSFNKDKPYDQFVREQIAGDLLPYKSDEQRAEQMIATGFLMVGTKMLSERDKEKLRMDVVDEQINTVGAAFMGMTMGCARCHDHKFDPIPTSDYYAMAGIFRSTKTLEGESAKFVSTWKRRSLPARPDHQAAVDQYEKTKNDLEKNISTTKKQLREATAQLAHISPVLTIDDSLAIIKGDWKSSTLSKGYIGKNYLHDEQSGKGEKSVEFPINISTSATYDVRVSYTPGNNRSNNVPVTVRHANGESIVRLNQQPQPKIDNLFTSIGQFPFKSDQRATVTISNRDTSGYVIADAIQLVQVETQKKPVKKRSAAEEKQYQQTKKLLEPIKTALKTLEAKLKQLSASAPKPLPQALAADEFSEISDCNICVRGEYKNKGPMVKRSFLQVAMTSKTPSIGKTESGRRQLADWIANPKHPLTARVIVNRIWYHLIGRGIVSSVDNFGELGDRPTHPELLDFLAADFMRDHWSIKKTIRKIVLSHSYRMSSGHRENCWKVDPENQLLWRAHRRRLPAEAIRDSMLAMSNQLDLSPGKSPVPGLGTLVSTNSANAKGYQRQQTTKRSLYLPVIRNELPPILTLFDFADPDMVTGKRAVTNVPAQALLLMNSPFVMDCSDHAAAKILKAVGDNNQNLVTATYQLIFSRPPTEKEMRKGVEFLQQQFSIPNEKAERLKVHKKALAQFIHILFASTEFRMQG
ncbi:DUF1553 domain-containing protein [uncultured Gimesia sp.]|uniref:DUF1553 domain-containing protein n=1 Tax=uncultured Gimesia sp. TaxID=1678688 RepID=UPI0026384BC3|nr:DUF1553 domain-containing protein [uncultured Gimesia sp.]